MSREQRLEAALRQAEEAMTAVVHDHPTVFSESVWEQLLNALGAVRAVLGEQEATPTMLPSADGIVQPDEHGLVWDIRDGVGYDFAVGATILRLLDEGRWDDEGILLHMAARSLMEPYYRRLDEQEATPPEPQHRVTFTVGPDGCGVRMLGCPFEDSDTARPCWPHDESGAPMPAPQPDCTYESWIEAVGLECFAESEFDASVVVVEFSDDGPVFDVGSLLPSSVPQAEPLPDANYWAGAVDPLSGDTPGNRPASAPQGEENTDEHQ